jgi:hypothetical protein
MINHLKERIELQKQLTKLAMELSNFNLNKSALRSVGNEIINISSDIPYDSEFTTIIKSISEEKKNELINFLKNGRKIPAIKLIKYDIVFHMIDLKTSKKFIDVFYESDDKNEEDYTGVGAALRFQNTWNWVHNKFHLFDERLPHKKDYEKITLLLANYNDI